MKPGIGTAALAVMLLVLFLSGQAAGVDQSMRDSIYDTGHLTPIDSTLKVAPGDPAPDFTLPAVSGAQVRLSSLKGRNVVLSFVPAAWTPVCSDQWPGYGISRQFFDDNDAVLLGITVDNLPTLYAWVKQMGNIWFEVLSDFWPHGQVASTYGLLRTDGTS